MLASLWENFLSSLSQDKEKEPIVYSVLKQLKPTALTEKEISLTCENPGVYYFITKKLSIIEARLGEFLGKKIKVRISLEAKKTKKEPPLFRFEPEIDDVFKKAGLSSKFSFENFAVSSTNQVGYAAAQAVSDNPGKAYNPLVLYGGVGVGKTHLAQSIAKKILEKKPTKKVFFSPGDQFMNELIEAIREKTTQKFRRKYRHLDLLIIDDVQFIAGKNTVQEEFFHTFNAILSLGGQIILTSDRHPSAIKNLEDRLRSRFSGGLTVDVQEPDFELRTAILLIKAKEKNIEIDIESAKAIAEQIIDSRSLEGTLLSLGAKILGEKERIDLDTVDSFFRNKGANDNNVRKMSHNDVLRTICSYYNIKQTHIKSSDRSVRLVLPRQIAMFILRKRLGLNFEEIAYILKKKDHTTVMHGVEKISALVAKDPVFRQELDRIISSLTL